VKIYSGGYDMSNIRIIEKTDDITYSQICDILKSAHKKAIDESGIEISTNNITPEELEEKISSLNGVIFVAIVDGRAVATTSVTTRLINRWFAKGLVASTRFTATLPEYQRRGIARKLKEKAISYSIKKGYYAMMSTIAENNIPSYNLQISEGYTPVDFIKFTNINHCSIRLIKWLGERPYPICYCKLRYICKKIYVKLRLHLE